MQTDHSAHPAAGAPGPGYETRDASVRGLVIFAIGLFVTLALTFVAVAATFRAITYFESLGPPAAPFVDQRTIPATEPLIQADPRPALQELRSHEKEILDGYGWVNPKAGIVRIPIDRAMELLLKKGLPVHTEQAEKK